MQDYAFNMAHSSMRDTSQFYIRISVHLCITLFLPLVAEVQDGVPGGFGKVPGGPGRVTGALSKGTGDHGKALVVLQAPLAPVPLPARMPNEHRFHVLLTFGRSL